MSKRWTTCGDTLKTGSVPARITFLDVTVQQHPMAAGAGIFQPDDPLVREWKASMDENRKRDDESPNLL